MDECKLSFDNDNQVTYLSITRNPVPHTIVIDALTRETIDRFKYWAANYPAQFKRDDLRVLGLHLYNMIFPPDSDIRKEFEQDYKYFNEKLAEGKKKGEEHRLRVTLVFNKDARALADYPWEFLYVPLGGKGFFMAGEKTELILARFIPDATVDWEPDEQPLRILIVLAWAKGMPQIEAEYVIDFIEKLADPDHIEVKTEREPTYSKLSEIINDKHSAEYFPPHILHFIGHGDPGKLYLVKSKELAQDEMLRSGAKEPDYKDPTDGETFSKLFHHNPPKLVFLHACEGAKPGSIDGFNDIAHELVYSNVPAVVAMQYEIQNEAASRFALEFYKKISEGYDIDEAVKEGRWKLGNPDAGSTGAWNDRSFGTPVLYLQREVPIIKKVKPGERVETGAPSKPPAGGKVPCPNGNCIGMVQPGDKICLICNTYIMECPQCHRLIDRDIHKCANCLWGITTTAQPLPPQGDRL